MKRIIKISGRGGRLMALAFTVALVLAACDTTQTDVPEAEATDTDLQAMAETLTAELQLSGAQAADVRSAFAGQDGKGPGRLWHVAAALQDRLTDAQKERLRALTERVAEQMKDARGEPAARRTPGAGFGHRMGQGDRAGLAGVLTEEQRETLAEKRDEIHAQMESLRADKEAGTLSEADFREQMKALMDDMRQQMEALLTDEQKATLAERREELKARMEERKAAAEAARIEALGLSDEQQTALRKLREEHKTAAEALKAQVQAGSLTGEDAREAFRALRDEMKTEGADILTDTQKEIVAIHRALSLRMLRMKKDRPGQEGPAGPRARRGHGGMNG